MTGRHRANGRHRKPTVPNPKRRGVVLRVVCGCAACAVVIPLFMQPTAGANPPDLTSSKPVLVVVPPLAAIPPTFTIQPRVDTVDMLTSVNDELSKHDDSHKGDSNDAKGSDHDSSSHRKGDDTSDYHRITPPSSCN